MKIPKEVKIGKKGMSLIELLLVVLIVGFLVLLIGNLPSSLGLIGISKHKAIALEIISRQIESSRSSGYEILTIGTTNIIDSRLSNLPSGSGQKIVEGCLPPICQNSEPIKKVTVRVTWVDSSKNQSVEAVTFIGEGGLK